MKEKLSDIWIYIKIWGWAIWQYILRVLVAFDQLLNTLIGGAIDETMSAALYRLRDKNWAYKLGYWTINLIFFWQDDHCKMSYDSEMSRKHLPDEYK